MLTLVRGDLFCSGAEALVNPVNCMGVAGKGLAKAFRLQFPENHAAYLAQCDAAALRTGLIYPFATGANVPPYYILNFPTKHYWWESSTLQYIDTGLRSLLSVVQEFRIRSLAVPALGCGEGGLAWEEVRPRIESAFLALPDVCLYLYPPHDT